MTDNTSQFQEDMVRAYRASLDEGGTGPDWFTARRRDAMDRFEGLGLPTRKIEDWKYTSLRLLNQGRFLSAPSEAASLKAPEGLPNLGGPSIVFVNGKFNEARSRIDGLPEGVTLLPLARALDEKADLLQSVLDKEQRNEDSLRALNTALLTDGLFLHVAAGVELETPITVIHVAGRTGAGDKDSAGWATQMRHVVLLEDKARASVVETFTGASDTAYWNNLVRDVRCGPGAHLDVMTLIDEGWGTVHTGHTDARIDRDSRFAQTSMLIGGTTTRHEVRVSVDGEGAEADLAGAYLGAEGQSFTVFTELDHRVPHGRSSQLYRGVLDSGAHSAFQGRVIVRQGAQKTDASQANHNLLLDRSAEADTKPELEIYADDVKCAHGATVGELDEDMLFYLESRGLDPETARAMLVEAFIGEVIERVRNPELRDWIGGLATNWMKRQGAALS